MPLIKEIETFIALGKEDHIFPFIVEGTQTLKVVSLNSLKTFQSLVGMSIKTVDVTPLFY